MGFKEAFRVCFKEKYVTFSGRAPRSEYWWFMLASILVPSVLIGIGVAGMNFDTGEPSVLSMLAFGLAGLFYLAVILPMLSVLVRRFHDVNLSGWWYLAGVLAGMIPYVGILASIAVFVVTVLKGTDGENKFGSDPLKPQSSAEVFA